MKKLILLAGVASLAACGGDADEAAVEDTATDEVVVEEVTEAPTYVGTHTVYDAEGTSLGTTVTNADGTYTDTNADGSTGAGTWAMNDMGQICFDPDGDEEGETCWTKGEETDGRVAWTNPDGETVMVDFTAA